MTSATTNSSASHPAKTTKSTRVSILDAAKGEFAKHGLAGARVDKIAEIAGVNKAMLYYHFSSKRNLFFSVVEDFYRQGGQRRRQWMTAGLPPEKMIVEAATAFQEILSHNPQFIPILLRAIAGSDTELLDRIGTILTSSGLPADLWKSFERLKTEGRIRPLDTRATAMAFLILNIGYYLFAPLLDRVWHITDRERFIQQWKQTIADVFVNGVKPETK